MKKIFLFTTFGILLTSAAGPASKLVQQSPVQNPGNENPNTRLSSYTKYTLNQSLDTICKKKMGDNYQGGVLCAFATMDHDSDISNQCHGFVCAPADLPAASWADAAAECRALRTGGYTNWRLPTKDELIAMNRLYRQGLANISWWSYWSSNDNFNNNNNNMNNMAWYYYFGAGRIDFETKNAIHPVRAVRSF